MNLLEKTSRRFFVAIMALAMLFAPLPLYAADVSITAANVAPSTNAQTTQAVAGATITAGQAVYLDSTTNTIKLADANNTVLTADAVGIAINGASSGQPIIYQTGGDITVGGTVTVGGVYLVSANAGGIAPVADLTTGWFTKVLLIGKTASVATIINRGPSSLVAVP